MNMKTLLNLLPEGKKDAIQNRLRSRFLLWQLFLVFVLEVFYLSILVSAFVVLDFQLKSLGSIGQNAALSARSEERRLNEYERKFQETNVQVDVVGKIDRSHLYFSRIFSLLDTLTPAGITVNQMKTEEYKVSLSGRAAKREDLLLFDKQLKEAEVCITDVNVPVSNLFSQEDIDFQLDFSVQPQCLRNKQSL